MKLMRKMTHNDFDHMVSFFDQMVQTSWLKEVHSQIIDHAQGNELGKVLDIGCGTGKLLQRLLSKYKSGVGIDLSPEMVREATRQASAEGLSEQLYFEEGNAYQLPFEANQFDASFSTCVMFLLPEPVKGIAEMIRVTKSKGQIMMLNPTPSMSQEAALSYIQKYQLHGFEAESLAKWSNVSVQRHRYSREAMADLLQGLNMTDIQFIEVLDGLAYITYATKN
jgi:ubiquinone/menaquinone biosynthesis C-methylase UbiE